LKIDTGTPCDNEDGQRRSWSQYVAFGRCAKAWQLSKLRRVPRRPGVWLAVGTAVHTCIEAFLDTQPTRKAP